MKNKDIDKISFLFNLYNCWLFEKKNHSIKSPSASTTASILCLKRQQARVISPRGRFENVSSIALFRDSTVLWGTCWHFFQLYPTNRNRFFGWKKFHHQPKRNWQNDRWLCDDPKKVPVVMSSKFPASVMVLGVVSNEGDIMPPTSSRGASELMLKRILKLWEMWSSPG